MAIDFVSTEREAMQRALAQEFRSAVKGLIEIYNRAEDLGLVLRFQITPVTGKLRTRWHSETTAVETKPVEIL